MAILSAAKRKKLPAEDMAKKVYPVNDAQQVKAKVKKKFPGIR